MAVAFCTAVESACVAGFLDHDIVETPPNTIFSVNFVSEFPVDFASNLYAVY